MALPVLLASGAMGMAYVFALIDWCGEECRPSSTLGYVAYLGSSLYVVTTWVALYVGIKVHQRLREQKEAALAATAIAHQAQLRMLRYQLNPHFLFNTLNAITTLNLDGDTATANRMVEGLSAFLRHSLDNDPMQRVTRGRGGRCASGSTSASRRSASPTGCAWRSRSSQECRRALVPSLLLQPLVENAIKHAVSKKVEGGMRPHRRPPLRRAPVAERGR